MRQILALLVAASFLGGCTVFTYHPPYWKNPKVHWHKHKKPKRISNKTVSKKVYRAPVKAVTASP